MGTCLKGKSAAPNVGTKHRLLYIATYKVQKAVKENKIFTVYGNYPIIREALRQRGWIEWIPPDHVLQDERVHGHNEELHKLMSSMVIHKKPSFYWNAPSNILNELKGDQLCNHFRRSGCLNTRRGLNDCLRNLHRFYKAEVDSFYPRCYWIGDTPERKGFFEDFRRTACSSLLQHVVEHDKPKLDYRDMLQKIWLVNPQMILNGTQNMWIVKPEAKSQGRENIFEEPNKRILLSFGKTQVVQKYIERPFLVHGTKVDVRQWFLVSSLSPLTVWFYKKAYVCFSTQPFSFKILDRSVHLCNNSLHKHLKPSPKSDLEIPQDSTWCCHQFEMFLQAQGKGGLWKEKVVPEMKRAIIRAMLTAQEHLESRSNSFELYGADFVLGEDLHPWFIEVNSRPSLSGNTAVKSRLCAAVQRDTLKVVLDRKHDPTADTGHFDMIFQQKKFKVPKLSKPDLIIRGVRYPKHPVKKQYCPKKMSSTTVKPMASKQQQQQQQRGLRSQNTASKYSTPSSRPQIGSHPCLPSSVAQQREGTTTFRVRPCCRVTQEPAHKPPRTSQVSATPKPEHLNPGVIYPRPPFTLCKSTSSRTCKVVKETADVKRLQRPPQTPSVSTQKSSLRSASSRVEADDRSAGLDRTSSKRDEKTAALCMLKRRHWR